MEAYSVGEQQQRRPILERKRKFITPSEASIYMNLKTVISRIQVIWDVTLSLVGWFLIFGRNTML